MGSVGLEAIKGALARVMAVGACCENISVHSTDKEFAFSKYTGDFSLQLDGQGEPTVCNEAAVFVHTKGKLFVYRSKDNDWVVGAVVANNKKGVHMRSHDPDRDQYIHECPCQTQVWQTQTPEGKWQTDKTVRVMIRQAQKLI